MRPCRDDGHCSHKQDEFYTFEAEGEGLFEWIARNDKEWNKKRREDRKEKERVSHDDGWLVALLAAFRKEFG